MEEKSEIRRREESRRAIVLWRSYKETKTFEKMEKVNLQNHFMQIKGGKTNMFIKFDVKFDVFQIWRKKENCFHVTSAAMNQRGVSPQTLWTSIFRNFVLVYKQTMVLLGIHL